MASSNKNGQILIEICLVMALVLSVAFAALSGMSTQRVHLKKYQFTKEHAHVAKTHLKN